MLTYVVTGFQSGMFRTYEIKQLTVSDVIAHAEAQGIEIETIQCRAKREVYRKAPGPGNEWTCDKYLPPKKVGRPGEHNALYLVSFFLPPVGLVWGGIRAACGMSGGVGALVAAGIGAVVWGVAYVFVSPYL